MENEEQQKNIEETPAVVEKRKPLSTSNASARVIEIKPDKDYIQERIISQSQWHSSKSSFYQKKYKKIKRIEFALAASIPVLIGFSTMDFVKVELAGTYVDSFIQVVAAVAGIFLAYLNKVEELEECFKLWKGYRVIAENLDMERLLYETRTAPYDEDDAYALLVSKVEGILNENVKQWQQVKKQEPKQSKDNKEEGEKKEEKE